MAQRLIVMEPFGDHARGDRIAKPADMAKVLKSHPNHVLREDAPTKATKTRKATAAAKATRRAAKAKAPASAGPAKQPGPADQPRGPISHGISVTDPATVKPTKEG